MNRRNFVKASAATAIAGATLTSCTNFSKRNPSALSEHGWTINESDKFDFIIVGSGAGGGPLAAGLAKEGFTVLLLEAGGSQTNKISETPVFHAKASDDSLLNWSYFVQRYAKEEKFKMFELGNSKYLKDQQGVYYPRASGVGGCTRVNALINLYPDHNDWKNLAANLDDQSWSPSSMYQLYQGMQKNNGGWLNLSQANPTTLAKDTMLVKMLAASLAMDAVKTPWSLGNFFDEAFRTITGAEIELAKKLWVEKANIGLNPNHPGYALLEKKLNGVFNIPFNATDGVRKGVREHILNAEQKYSNKLFIKTESLCTRVLFDENDKTKAIGIEFMEGAHAYKADVLNSNKAKSSYVKKTAFAAKEVILAGGAFSTPQLMMLSGIGPAEELRRMNIPVVLNKPGVGRNLQDRYEVTVVSELNQPISLIKDCTFAKNNDFESDPCWQEYQKNPQGHLYGTNGVALSLIRRSSPSQATPDLCIFGLPGNFKGYYPNYSNDTTPKNPQDPSYFTWAILKGHTKNHAGYVALKSNDPRDTPEINFKYFHDPENGMTDDLNAVLAGLKMTRKLNSNIGSGYLKKEVYPGSNIKSDADLKSWIEKESWGHHASCTSKMGLSNDPMAVVDNNFKVHGIQNLRIVDASVFPDIPGLFIMLPTLMISEKAKDVIIQDYRS